MAAITIKHAAFSTHQLVDHAGINGGRWFLGAPYLDKQTGGHRMIPRAGGAAGVFWAINGGILDEYEIAQGSGNRYPTVTLYDTESDARAELDKRRATAAANLKEHERQCNMCAVGFHPVCETGVSLAYCVAELTTGINQ